MRQVPPLASWPQRKLQSLNQLSASQPPSDTPLITSQQKFASKRQPKPCATSSQVTGLLTVGIVVLFILHYQFTPEFTERKIYKPTSSYTREPAKNHVEHFHYVAPKAEAAAVAAPSVVEPETPSAAAMQEIGDLGVEAYTGGSPYDCKPSRVPRGTRALDYVAPPGSAWPVNCDQDDNQALCDVVKKVAVDREVLTAVCNSNVIGQLEKWVDANRRSGITNMVIIAIDNRLPEWLEKNGVACWHKVQSAVGSHKISAQKFKLVKQFLSTGTSVIMSDIDVVYLQNPFLFLHKVRASARQPPATHPQPPPTPHPTRWRASASGTLPNARALPS